MNEAIQRGLEHNKIRVFLNTLNRLGTVKKQRDYIFYGLPTSR